MTVDVIVEKEEPKPETKSLISINERQGLVPKDNQELVRFVEVMLKARALPRHLTTIPEVISAWNYAAQLGLPPQPSLRNIAVIEGTPSLFGDLPLALTQKHSDFVSNKEYCIDKEYKEICVENKNLEAEPWGGICEMRRKGMDKPQTFAFTRADAERAGLIRRAKPGMPWHTYPQVMLVRRARSMAIKTLFADAITGAAIAEYETDFAPDLVPIRDVGPKENSDLEDLNSRYGGNGSSQETPPQEPPTAG